MAKLEGTQTKLNLMKAFAGESQARSRYTYFASVARKEGYRQIEAIFTETAENELEHAKVFYKHLVNGLAIKDEPQMVDVEADYPVILSSSTYHNLIAAAAGEREEWEVLYRTFGDIAEEEGFSDIAASFRMISKVEKVHEERYVALAELVDEGTFFKRDEVVRWKCRNCGYVHEGAEAVEVCPACKHGREHFELYCRPY